HPRRLPVERRRIQRGGTVSRVLTSQSSNWTMHARTTWLGRVASLAAIGLTGLPAAARQAGLEYETQNQSFEEGGGMKTILLGCISLLVVFSTFGSAPTAAQEKPSLPPEQVKIVGAWSRTLAVQAATYAAPIVAMYNLRETVAVGPKAKVAPGELWRLENIATPKIAAESGYVSPNVDTIYGFGFLDLGQETRRDHLARLGWPVLHDRDRGHVEQCVRLCRREGSRVQGGHVCAGRPWLEGRRAEGHEADRCPDTLGGDSAARACEE